MKTHDLNPLFKILKIKPKDVSLYYQALTHKTYANENKKLNSYEKLEFLGDSILQMYSSLFIYKTFKNEHEGTLSIIRTKIVSSDSLAKIIKKNKINQFLICSNNVNDLIDNNKICSDLFESILAAIYLDLGEKEALNYLNRFLFKDIKTSSFKTNDLKDPKTKLQELLQPIFKNPINYICYQENDLWFCKVMCFNITYGEGSGKTKKEAETNSAQNALKKFKS